MSARRGDGPSSRGTPPGLAGALLDFLEGPEAPGTLRGDLDEEFARHVLPERGLRAARLWYWRQMLTSAPRLVLRRVTRRGDRPDGWVRRIGGDLRHAVRSLRRRPGSSAAAVLTLALALGMNTSVFSVVYGVLLRPLPFEEESGLVRIHPDEAFYIQLGGAQRFSELTTAFEHVLPWARTIFTFADEAGDGEAEEVRGGLVAWDHFDALGVRPVLGRAFRAEDAEAWPYEAIVLSHALWVRRFGADPAVVGKVLNVSGRSRTVIGVLSADHVPTEPDWGAWGVLPLDATAVAGAGMAMNARLRPGASLAEATLDAREGFRKLWTENGSSATPDELASIRLIPLREHLVGSVARPLWVLMGTAAGILLLACANVANLLLVQADTRASELAVRLSLGATRGRLTAMLLTETAVLAVLGGLAGLGMASAFLGWASSRLPADLPRAATVELDPAVLAFAAGCVALAAILATVAPVLSATGKSLRPALAGGGRGRNAKRGGVASVLVGVEVAVSVVVVVGAGLMLRSLEAFSTVDPGFEASGVVTVRVAPPAGRYEEDGAIDRLYADLRREVASLPQVTSAGAMMFLPMTSGGAWTRYRTTPDAVPDAQAASFRIVTPGYFETMNVRLVGGRTFTEADEAEAPAVAVINQTMARDYFPGEDPVGRYLYEGADTPDAMLVVGVVADVRQTDLREASFPEVYLPLSQNPFRRMYVVARTEGDEIRTLAAVQDVVRRTDPQLVLSRSAIIEDVVASTVTETRLLAQLLTLLGLVALGLGSVGVYGVTAHRVARTRREIGIRLALGADGGSVASRVVGRGMVPVVAGLLAGLALSLGVARLLEGLLFGVPPTDPVTLTSVSALLAAVALVALSLPAARASRVDPAATLRRE